MLKNIRIGICCFMLLTVSMLFAQKTEADKKAFDLLENAFGKYIEQQNMAMYFEAMASGIKNPEDIFSLPSYKVYRGGYFFILKDKYEIQLATIKALCDGKVSTLIDEGEKLMIIDSVHRAALQDSASYRLEMETLLEKTMSGANLKYEGESIVNRVKCHKIRAKVSGAVVDEVLYYVTINTGTLYLMAERADQLYTVYWFTKIEKLNAAHKFDIQLPKKQLDNLYGYKVIDNRFSLYHAK